MSASANLTQLEGVALEGGANLSDGHARHNPTPAQAKIIEALPELFWRATMTPPAEMDLRAQRAFTTALGQHRAPVDEGRVLSCYASSVAMEIFARALRPRTDAVALVHPTFDNIPDILRGFGFRLQPLEEDLLHGAPDQILDRHDVGCVFVTTPNNPTGRVLSADALATLAASCAERDVILTLDTSFRGFDARAQYDHYAILDESGARYVVIEDTGKLWPTLDLKVGLLAFGPDVGIELELIHSEILLGVSPLILALVEAFAGDAADGGLSELHEMVAANRALLHDGLAGVPGITFPDWGSRASVERVDLGPGRSAAHVSGSLRESGVHLLPCNAFYWADRRRGQHQVRVALSRPPAMVEMAVQALASALE